MWCADLSDEENGARAITAVVELSKKVGTAQSIQQMGGDEATIAEAVQQALTGEYRSSFSAGCVLRRDRVAESPLACATYHHALARHLAD